MFSGSNASGHGTRLKHRSAFSKIKAHQNKKKRIGDENLTNKTTTNSSRKRVFQEMSKTEKVLKTMAFVASITLVSILIYIVVINQQNTLVTNNPSLFDEKRKEEMLQHLIPFGEQSLDGKLYESAQYSFDKVLRIDSQNVRASVGMTEVLCNRCAIEQLYCKEAQNYLNAITKNRWISRKKAKKLQAILKNQPPNICNKREITNINSKK